MDIQGYYVVGTTSYVCDVLQGGNQHRSGLHFDVLGESDNSVSAAEGTPAKDKTISRQQEGSRIGGGNLADNVRVFELAPFNLGRGAFNRVDSGVIIVIVGLLIVNVTHPAGPGSITTKGLIIIDAPGENSVILG
ncbi:hypothetical protein RRF57_013249 [Xylaria bambusicola]|uniref:Uncharacterized protein n=1 Tax=Xylaria bambusicola TaxID=326684 RepID=A0AAN7V6D2_9PEZI